MPAPTTTLLIEGSFSELAEEFAQYLDSLSQDESSLQTDLAPQLQPLRDQEQNEQDTDVKQRDEVLKKLVAAAAVLNTAPEKGKPPRPFKPGQGLKILIKMNRNHICLQPPHPPGAPRL